MNKFKQRVTSLLLSTLMVLPSISVMITIQEPTVVHAMENNNMVWGTQDYVDLSRYDGTPDAVKPAYQMLRFSLITTGEPTDSNIGTISEDVPNNPISIANPNGGLQSYNESQIFEKNKVRQLVNKNRYDRTIEEDPSLLDSKHVLNTRRDYIKQEEGT